MGRLRKGSRFGRARRSRSHRSLMASNAGPAVLLIAVVLAAIAVIAALVIFVAPPVMEMLGLKPTPTPVPTPVPTPRPTLMQIQQQPPSVIQKEVIVSKRYASHPMMLGKDLLYSSGSDEGGNPKMYNFYIYNTEKNETNVVEGLKLDGDDFLYGTMNESWLLFLDAKRAGGGWIKALDRKTGTAFTVKRVYIGTPVVRLVGSWAFWIERTGTRMDKLFAFDLKTKENVAIATFDNSIYGQGTVGACEKEIVWADADPKQDIDEALVAPKSELHMLDLSTGKQTTFAPNMYVHDPQSNGSVRAWVNTNYSPEAALYIRDGNAAPEMVAEGIAGYGLGSNFVAYEKDEAIWVYLWGNGVKQKLTGEKEKAMFLNVSNDHVLWLDVTIEEDRGKRDILKYAPVE